MYGYIYKTTDIETGLIYVGQKKSSKFLNKHYIGSGTDISNFKKADDFDINRFQIEMIDTAESANELNQKEIYWIEKLDSRNKEVGYNRCCGGITNTGFVQSDYQKKVASEYMSNRVVSDETRARMSHSATLRTSNRVTNNNQVWIHNSVKEIMVEENKLDEFLDNGYVIGRLPMSEEQIVEINIRYHNSTYVTRDGRCILVKNEELNNYLADGWIVGRIYSDNRGSQISKGKRGTVKIVNIETGKCKYIKPELLDTYRMEGYVTLSEYSKKKTS